jgi:hypothetical protein
MKQARTQASRGFAMRMPLPLSVFVAVGMGSAAVAQEPERLLLQVIRLKPGESRFIELGIAGGFRPAAKSGRSDLAVHLLSTLEDGNPKRVPAEKAVAGEHFKAAPHRIREGVELLWSAEKPGIEIRVDPSAPAGACDVRISYYNFGSKEHAAAFQVIVSRD